MPSASFHTLGCRLNQSESASVADDLIRHGYEIVEYGKPCDVVVINTCAVTGVASQKSRQAVRLARRTHPDARLVVMGCDASVDAASWKACGVDILLPHPVTESLSSLLAAGASQPEPASLPDDFRLPGCAGGSDRTRANLKIQDGCDFFCTYCIVPYARGPARSRDRADVLREARSLVGRGFRELVLCGVNLTTYSSGGADLADLIGELLSMEGDFRIRLGSAEPGDVIPKVVDMMAKEPRLCRFLHLPLQYGEDTVLERMGRHYTTARYRTLCSYAHAHVPGICLGTDVILGFPGETEDSYEACRRYIEEIPFGLLHIFPYSERPGTAAAEFPDKVPAALAARRASDLMRLAEKKVAAFVAGQMGTTLQVLVEENGAGWSDNYLHVHLPQDATRNTFEQVTIRKYLGKREVE